jgi:CD109 antigen
MKNRLVTIAGIILTIAVLMTMLPACKPAVAASSYLAVVPSIMHSGRSEAISLSLFNGDTLVKGQVEVTLLKDAKTVTSTKKTIDGSGTVVLNIPDVPDGKYDLQVKGGAFTDTAAIQVQKSYVVFVETDKPIYKPGQTMHIRVMTLDPELKPTQQPATVDIVDAKGIKIYRRVVQTDDYGMVMVDLPISSEPNLGAWKIKVTSDKAENQLDVQVQEYVLPKYEVTVDLPKEWFLVSEPIKGKISSTYSFGKPVNGTMTITAAKYVGQWQRYTTVNKDITGSVDFEIPPAQYVAGTPAGGGQGNVQLDITVTEKSTGYVEKTSKLVTVAQSPVNLQLITESDVFKPGLPFSTLVITQTPDKQPVDAGVSLNITYMDASFQDVKTEKKDLNTTKGKASLDLVPPSEAIALMIQANSGDASATKTIRSSYSPSGNFIHLEQTSEGTPAAGQKISFHVYSTRSAVNFYYEVIARGMVVFSSYTNKTDISFATTPLMAPSARLLVYQILPDAEVAADYLPFNVENAYPQQVQAGFNKDKAQPGDNVTLNIKAEDRSRVGLAAVDKSVFILAENRLNLEQVFAELERLYMQPQAEIHSISFYPTYTVPSAQDTFQQAGVTVMTNKTLPGSKNYQSQKGSSKIISGSRTAIPVPMMTTPAPPPATTAAAAGARPPAATVIPQAASAGAPALAEVKRIRQFFPETWIWSDLTTDSRGKASQQVTVPDSITTWMLRAVAISKEKGLGIGEGSLVVFQPFFETIDLPYSAIRGEEFPVNVAVYNYLNEPQTVQLDLGKADWFEVIGDTTRSINIAANDIGAATFTIRPTKTGVNDIKVSARSPKMADAVIKTVIIEPEGVARELVGNITLAGGITQTIDTAIPDLVVADSGRAYIAVTSSVLTQTIDGLDNLLKMPSGCGEQNMIVLAPDVYITKYLQGSGQLKAEIMAKAEKLMITGYQRELTYRRKDGSFSAFGMNDPSGSLWLTAFVLKVFAQAKGLLYIDDSVLSSAASWITKYQQADGSFEAVGFVHHQEMLGGVQGKDALTAYVAIALMTAGEKDQSGRAVSYLESKLPQMSDPYGVAITAYALELAKSSQAGAAHDKLMSLAKEDENGLYWGNPQLPLPAAAPAAQGGAAPIAPAIRFKPQAARTAEIETTAYATLALNGHGDTFNASQAARWLVSKRNASGGYGSTQDTVVTLQALAEFAAGSRADVNLTLTLKGNTINQTLKINKDNYDVLQTVAVPVNTPIEIKATGTGNAIGQVVRRYNIPEVDTPADQQALKIEVKYDTTEVAVNDLVKVDVSLAFNPPPTAEIKEAGMIVLDVSVPTGFEPVIDSIAVLTRSLPNIKRYDLAGRKVIFYVENMKPGQRIAFSFRVKALYPVKAKGVASTAYSYYTPDIKGETLGPAVTVR